MRIVIELSDDQVALLAKDVNGNGGWQGLLRTLQSQRRGNELILTVEDIGRIVRYTTRYGDGGFEERLRPILNQVMRLASEISTALERRDDQT